MIDDLVRESARRVLDVGCGTGIAGRLLAERGCTVLGVEPDERMAAVARGHGLTVELGTFEEWEPAGRVFDVLSCGQAWHWVDPLKGPLKAAEVVRPGGAVALFWNQGRQDDDLREPIEQVYRELAPGLEEYSILLRNLGRDRFDATAASLQATGAFAPPVVRSYPWTGSYTRDEWLNHLMTHSDHRTMDPATRSRLFDRISEIIDRAGGGVRVRYECWLVTARRTPGPA